VCNNSAEYKAEADLHIYCGPVLHPLVYLPHHVVVQIVHPAPICNADHDARGVPLEMFAEVLGAVEEVECKALRLGFLNGFVTVTRLAVQPTMKYLAGFPPLITVRHGEQGVVVGKQFSCSPLVNAPELFLQRPCNLLEEATYPSQRSGAERNRLRNGDPGGRTQPSGLQ